MKEIKELLDQIDDHTLSDISETRRRLVQFLRDEVYSDKKGGGNSHA